MLERIAKRDKEWRSIALSLTGCTSKADELVQDMYLRLHKISEKYPDKEIKDAYAFSCIYTMFYDAKRKKKYEHTTDDLKHVRSDETKYELDDEDLELLQKVNELPRAFYKVYLEMSHDMSLRDIGEVLNTDYGFIYRKLKEARKYILEDDYDTKYRNKRNKRK